MTITFEQLLAHNNLAVELATARLIIINTLQAENAALRAKLGISHADVIDGTFEVLDAKSVPLQSA